MIDIDAVTKCAKFIQFLECNISLRACKTIMFENQWNYSDTNHFWKSYNAIGRGVEFCAKYIGHMDRFYKWYEPNSQHFPYIEELQFLCIISYDIGFTSLCPLFGEDCAGELMQVLNEKNRSFAAWWLFLNPEERYRIIEYVEKDLTRKYLLNTD